jgi:hypothetical protein
MEKRRLRPIIKDMLPSGYDALRAEAAFDRVARARRRAAIARLLRKGGTPELPVYDERCLSRLPGRSGRREIPLEQINATLEPHRARQFDSEFRPAKNVRRRWERIWSAEQKGMVLPPIEVVPVEGGFALRDGHHRVSVARARGAVAIDAIVDGPLAA